MVLLFGCAVGDGLPWQKAALDDLHKRARAQANKAIIILDLGTSVVVQVVLRCCAVCDFTPPKSVEIALKASIN